VDTPFFASTRGQIVLLLRRASRTVDELAEGLDITDNAVRAHLATLERDGLVEQQGTRRGVSKPAAAYGLTSEAERLFPKAYDSILAEFLAVLREQLSTNDLADVLSVVGQRIAASQKPVVGDIDARLARAVDAVEALGGLAELERSGETFVICGYNCPFAAIAAQHPDICSVVGALLSDLVGVAVREQCERGEHPRCRFSGSVA
jgi:predicted ArsR family transcriptional regulator